MGALGATIQEQGRVHPQHLHARRAGTCALCVRMCLYRRAQNLQSNCMNGRDRACARGACAHRRQAALRLCTHLLAPEGADQYRAAGPSSEERGRRQVQLARRNNGCARQHHWCSGWGVRWRWSAPRTTQRLRWSRCSTLPIIACSTILQGQPAALLLRWRLWIAHAFASSHASLAGSARNTGDK